MNSLELFCDRLIDYKAIIGRAANNAGISELIFHFLQEVKATSVVVPHGLDKLWLTTTEASNIRILCDDPPLSKSALNETSAVITTATTAIAETGTLVLDHRLGQGRRIISLLPDTHICIIQAQQVLSSVPEAIDLLTPSVLEKRPMTWISGPSATVDIELIRVEGVHGPRNLYVIIVD